MRSNTKSVLGIYVLLLIILLVVVILFLSQRFFIFDAPHGENTFDVFTSGILWQLCLIFVLIADKYWYRSKKKSAFWMLGSFALLCLALDETMAFHEQLDDVLYPDDDLIKVILWNGTAGIFYFIHRIEPYFNRFIKFFILGYIFHTGYIIGDVLIEGMLDLSTIFYFMDRWLFEEGCQVLFLMMYLIGFYNIFLCFSEK